MDVRARVESCTGERVVSMAPLTGGCIAAVLRARLEGGGSVVVKTAGAGAGGQSLEPEGFMLGYLAERTRVPVPRVIHCEETLLVMGYIENGGGMDGGAEEHAAEILAALHGIGPASREKGFGFERDTLIGSLPQPNPWTGSWVEFFGSQRLLFMAARAAEAGRLPSGVMRRIERLAGKLEELLPSDSRPSLIHGDVWGGNVLVAPGGGKIAALLDPALYFADAEIELAFITLFSTFGEWFFARYGEMRPIRDGFFETRRGVYNLYPLLVHARLFGGGYVGSVEATLRGLGF